MRLQAKREKVRELADMVGSVVIDENLPLDTLDMLADVLKEDYRQIRQQAKEIIEEQQAIEKIKATGKEC